MQSILRRSSPSLLTPASRAVNAACASPLAVTRSSTRLPFSRSAGLHHGRFCHGSSQHGALRQTRLLLREVKKMSLQQAMDLKLEHDRRFDASYGTSTLELNLLEDPTAGLAAGPAEELTSTELETRVRVLVSSYTPALYRLLYTPFIDVVGVLVREKLVPEAGDAKQLSTMTTTSTANSNTAAVIGDTGAGVHTSLIAGVDHHSSSRPSSPGGVGSSSSGNRATVSTGHRPVRPEEVMGRWFTDGASTLKHPHETAEAMGKRRWTAFCRALEAHWAAMEDVMPLTRVVRRHGLREELYVPLFRQLAMELADPTKRTAAVTTLPGFILSLANGRAPRSLGLPERDADRIRLVSALFLGVAQEAGDTDLAYLALQLLRANHMETPFAAQKQLTNVFAAASRIETDWQMRGASLLPECYRRWLDYFREVQQDNKVALESLRAAETRTDDGAKGSAAAAASASKQRQLAHPAASTVAEHDTIPRKRNSKGRGTKSTTGDEAGGAGATAPSVAAAAGGQGAAELEDGDGESTEQYRYFTSRRQDDVTRITALEENIAAAVRARAAELEGVRMRRRRKRKSPLLKDTKSANAQSAESTRATADRDDDAAAKEHVQRRASNDEADAEGEDPGAGEAMEKEKEEEATHAAVTAVKTPTATRRASAKLSRRRRQHGTRKLSTTHVGEGASGSAVTKSSKATGGKASKVVSNASSAGSEDESHVLSF